MQHEDIDGIKKLPAGKALAPRRMAFIALTISICFLLSPKAAHAQSCGLPLLNGGYILNPCSLPPPVIPPGSTFQSYLAGWWTGQFQPALKSMTAQLYTYRLWETENIGSLMDTVDVNRAARVEQEQRLKAQQGVLPDDQVCIAASSSVVQNKTINTAAALTQGFKQDLLRRAHNAVENPVNGSYTPPGMTPASDRLKRWKQFCKEFYDPNSNDGQSPCGSSAGPVMNQDISAEGFLLRDTIDLSNPDNYQAAEALLINIVQPVIDENLGPTVVNTSPGQETILRRQHFEAIRNVAADVVGSIISRRAPLSQTDSNLAQQVVDIRKQAGLQQCPQAPQVPVGDCYSTTPSYNEIMQALTKERFFTPAYFVKMENNPGAIQQEQAAIDGYTTVQMQDIYKMQEQINALLAARASLKLSTDETSSEVSSAPN